MLKKIRALDTKEKVNYFIAFGLIAVSGLPYFFSSVFNILLLCIYVLYIFLKRNLIFDTRALNIMGIFFLVELLQAFFIYSISPQTYIGTIMRFLLSYIAIAVCGRSFLKYYVNILYVLTIVSFVFYFPSALVPGIYDFFVNSICPLLPSPGSSVDNEFYATQSTILIFTFHPTIPLFRNPGAFWEPGAYAIFLNLAMIFNIFLTGKLISKKNIFFAIAIISTLSTTGFVAMFLIVVSFFVMNGDLSKKVLVLMMILPIVVYLFFTLEFLGAKISKNMELTDDTTSRFGSASADFEDFSSSPLIGWGKGEMRFGGKEFTFFTVDQHRNNGLTNLLATYGIFAFITLVYNYYRSYKALCLYYSFSVNFAILCFLATMMMGFGESIFQYPFFLSMMFLHLTFVTDKKLTLTD